MARASTNKKPSPDALLAQVRMMMTAGETATPEQLSRVEKLAKEVERQGKQAQAYVIASLGDQPLPVKFYSPWMSYARFNQLENAGKITTAVRRNGKVLIRASDFFQVFNSLPADVKRSKASTK